jgi:catechol 2,3-dioxygenase-like lactoylglutathione lyase family enzyme
MGVPELPIDLPEVDQVAFVVEDLDDGMSRFHQMMGIEPWKVYEYEPPEMEQMTYHGEEVEFSARVGLSYAGDTMFELIEPVSGPNIYDDHLDKHGEGLHHIGYFSWSEEEVYEIVEAVEDAGIGILQSGHYLGTDFWYFDTAEQLNGLIFETACRRNAKEREPAYTYP